MHIGKELWWYEDIISAECNLINYKLVYVGVVLCELETATGDSVFVTKIISYYITM